MSEYNFFNEPFKVGLIYDEFKPAFHSLSDNKGPGIRGESTEGEGVNGRSESEAGVLGESISGPGVKGLSKNFWAVRGETNSLTEPSVVGVIWNPEGTGAAIHGYKSGNLGYAGLFEGEVKITKNLTVDGDVILSNAVVPGGGDCAEYFDVAKEALGEPGSVMVLNEKGQIRESHVEYDKCAVGIVSGAGDYKPGILLDKRQTDNDF